MLMSEFSNRLFFPRPEFVWKFTRLKERWQSAAQGVRQRKSDIDELVRQWQYFTTSEGDLLHLLAYTSHLLSAVKSQDCYSLHQTRSLIHELKVGHAQQQCGNCRVLLSWKMFVRLRFCVFCDVQVCFLRWGGQLLMGTLLSLIISLVGSETQSYPFNQK